MFGFLFNLHLGLITGKNESLPRIVKNMAFLWKNFGILVEYRFSKESITLQRISNVWNYSNFGKFQEFCFYIKQHAIKPCCKTSPRLLINPVYACSKRRYLLHVIPRKRGLPEQCSRKSCLVPFLICI